MQLRVSPVEPAGPHKCLAFWRTGSTRHLLTARSKFVDSHLKPFRCKHDSCENAKFSSTACLLRHEREAHGMHGHGDKPYFCTYESCERSVSGNGFPRQWNLRDHLRRVHNDTGLLEQLSGF